MRHVICPACVRAQPLVRVDDGVVEGGEVSMHYDPMLSKLITHGEDREQARHTLVTRSSHARTTHVPLMRHARGHAPPS